MLNEAMHPLFEALVYAELERFGKCEAGKKRFNHDYYAHKSGYEMFLESGSRFSSRPLPEHPSGQVKIVSSYPEWYIEEYNRTHSGGSKN